MGFSNTEYTKYIELISKHIECQQIWYQWLADIKLCSEKLYNSFFYIIHKCISTIVV